MIPFHEFAHSYNMVTGTGVSGTYNDSDVNNACTVENTERQATGLPLDHDGNSRTPEQLADQLPTASIN